MKNILLSVILALSLSSCVAPSSDPAINKAVADGSVVIIGAGADAIAGAIRGLADNQK